MTHPILIAGIPETNATLYWQIRFLVGDPAALIIFPKSSDSNNLSGAGSGDLSGERLLILRDIEMQRARKSARADRIACPADFKPLGGLSGDRETATAQATAESLRQRDITKVVADRTLPLIYVEILSQNGITVECDFDLGVTGRRQKDEQEIQWIRAAQKTTESAVRLACELIANADVATDGTLKSCGEILTAERVKFEISTFLLKLGYGLVPWIVASGKAGGDCHDHGSGPLFTEEPVIIDVYPMSPSRYWGDCTRTVVNGAISDDLKMMHAAVLDARKSAIEHARAGVTAESVHEQTIAAIKRHGFEYGLPKDNDSLDYTALTHGTGHGVGLCVHEPILLDFGGPKLLAGETVTIEPGLYRKSLGGVRVEDVVLIKENGCENLGSLYDGLDWKI